MNAMYGNDNNAMGSTSEFFKSNSMVMNFAFLILVLVVFIILLQLGIGFIKWIMSPPSSPHLLDGMIDAKQMMIFEQDPKMDKSKTIMRSSNENEGVEFTWSVWILVDDMEYNRGKFRHIFHKGEEKGAVSENGNTNTGLNHPNNAPGVYLTPVKNNLLVVMNTFHNVTEQVEIDEIPLNKWINLMIRCENRTLDVYINGTIVKRHMLSGVPKQNYGNVYTGLNGGFSGYISNLWYFDYGLGTTEIDKIIKKGADTTMSGNNRSLSLSRPNYLSFKWFLRNN
uniref:LamG-like jellyroll fold domain-containing protein n=1 Tax=viral metagenome TaxID=1070528 RepID=A0A6C0LV59_9ZZZZ